jgi:hypothetical protein
MQFRLLDPSDRSGVCDAVCWMRGLLSEGDCSGLKPIAHVLVLRPLLTAERNALHHGLTDTHIQKIVDYGSRFWVTLSQGQYFFSLAAQSHQEDETLERGTSAVEAVSEPSITRAWIHMVTRPPLRSLGVFDIVIRVAELVRPREVYLLVAAMTKGREPVRPQSSHSHCFVVITSNCNHSTVHHGKPGLPTTRERHQPCPDSRYGFRQRRKAPFRAC